MAEWFVAKAAEMSDGDRRIVSAGRHEIGVFGKDGAFYAYSNYCLHAGGPACEGLMINRVVDLIGPDRTYLGQAFADEMHFVCPWHGWEYDVTTGECAGDRKLRLRKYDVVRRGEDIFVVAQGMSRRDRCARGCSRRAPAGHDEFTRTTRPVRACSADGITP
jgi:nitrite reductase/ring-hydroxylating ferredoxin subunit